MENILNIKTPAFNETIEETERAYKTNVNKGLNTQDITIREEEFGPNTLETKKKKTIWEMFISQFSDFLILVLIVAAIVSGFLGEVSDAILILIIVLINAIIGVVQEDRAEKSMEALSKMVVAEAKVIRNGKQDIIDSINLVPGDIVLLEAGDIVPADGRLIEAANLQIQEAALTGESEAVTKETVKIDNDKTPLADRKNMVYSSTIVTNGRGVFIVTNTGMQSEIGKIAGLINKTPNTKTPLQDKLSELGKVLAIFCLAACAVIFIVGLIRGGNPLDLFMTAVSLAVAAIPEGLPAVVTVVLAMGTTRLVKKNAIIRKLPAVETLGAASVICSDKTGTLTQNKMTIERVYTYGDEGIINSANVLDNKFTEPEQIVVFSGLLCNDANIITDENGVVQIGDPTEVAMIDFADKVGYSKDKMLAENPRLEELPFDSDRKLMTTVHKDGKKFISYTKGAPDVLLDRCSYIIDANGEKIKLTDEIKENVLKANEELSKQAYRVIGYARKEYDKLPAVSYDELEEGLTFGGLTGMIDPPREEVKDSIKETKKAGIKTVMITGDHINTATAIAKELGIFEEGDLAFEGIQVDAMSDQELEDKIDKISVYARVSPENKVRIVDTWKKKNAIVSMTGDGVNDAPALKHADIGCAMGITGTEVTKDASELILTDDNFATIVTAVKEGRGIYENIKKAVHFLLSTNLAEILTLFLATVFGWAQPLLPIHILWINLITDSLPALALGMEETDPDVMNNKPRNPEQSLFANGLGTRIVLQGSIIAILSLLTFYFSWQAWGIQVARTMTFTCLATMQLTHAINVKMGSHSIFNKRLFTNKYFWGALAISLCLQLMVDLVPALHPIFQTVDLTSREWIWVVAVTVTPLILVEIGKLFLRIFDHFSKNEKQYSNT